MILGIDIGANKVAVVLYDGEIRNKTYEPYPAGVVSDYKKWLSWVEEFLKKITVNQEFSAAGVSYAGIINRGTVVISPNLSIVNGMNIAGDIGNILEKEVRVENDANCFLRAESQLGAVKGLNNVIGITIGTGVGGAILVNGKLYEGTTGSAGEVGHMVIDGEKTLDELAGAKGFKLFSDTPVAELADQARENNQEAVQIFQKVGLYLGRGLGNLVNAFDPEAIVLGGGIMGAADLLLPPARKEMDKVIISPLAKKKVEVLEAQFAEYAPALGAALLANKAQGG